MKNPFHPGIACFFRALPLIASLETAALALEAGDIAFVGFNADEHDDLAFVALKDIPGNTEIFFSDNEWNGFPVGGTGAFLDSAESELKWTAPPGGLAAGTVVSISGIENSAPLTVSTGTIAYTSSSNVGVGANGEAFFAYTGSSLAPEKFLTVIVSGAVTAAGSLEGTGLTLGVNASIFAGAPDVMAYTGARSGQASFAGYLPLLHNPANWITQDGTGFQHNDGTAPDTPFDATPFTITAPAPLPKLSIEATPPGFVTLSWTPDTPGWHLQESTLLTPGSWSNSASGSTNPAVIPITPDRKFFRLKNP